MQKINGRFNVMSFNCCLSVSFNGAYARAARLCDAVYSCIPAHQIDVICFQELVVWRDNVLKQFARLHHPNVSTVIKSSVCGPNIRFLSSGLFIVSRWPILEEDAHIFEGQSYNMEAYMAKAVQYCKLLTDNKHVIHVFNTHLQAWTNTLASSIRVQQVQQIAAFMQRKLQRADLKNEMVVVVGDGNVDLYENASVFQELMNILACQYLLPRTPQFSFDISQNALVATDDAREYVRRVDHFAGRRFPASSYAFVQSQGNHDALAPRQLVDFVAISQTQAADGTLVCNTEFNVLPVKTRAPFDIRVGLSYHRTLQTVSDHSAVVANISFMAEPTGQHLNITHKNAFTPIVIHPAWFLMEIIFAVMIFLIFILIFVGFYKLVSKLTVGKSPKIMETQKVLLQ